MNIAKKFFLSALVSAKQTSSSFSSVSPGRFLSSTNSGDKSQVKRVPVALEEFRRRREKGAVKRTADSKLDAADVVSDYGKFGMMKELIAVMKEISGGAGAVPSEIQCVTIPAVLDGKSVVLSSEAGSSRTLAYLLPLVQLLRCDMVSMKPKRPRAVVLYSTEEMSDECFQIEKYISKHHRSKSKGIENTTAPSLRMLVGTPSKILQQIEEGHTYLDDVKYLVLDEADAMLRDGLGPMIQKIISQIPDGAEIQTVVVTSPPSEMFDKEADAVMERIGKKHVEEIAATMMEIGETKVFDLVASRDSLVNKIAEAIEYSRRN